MLDDRIEGRRPGALAPLYHRGKSLLQALAALHPTKRIGSGRKRDKAVRAAAEHISVEAGGLADEIIEDAALAVAIDDIAEACGEDARRFLLWGDHRLTRKLIGQISRIHPIRQRHEIEAARLGRPVFAKPASGVAPYDTLGYHEVASRLARAQGNLRKQARVLCSAPEGPPDAKRIGMLANARDALAASRSIARLMRLRPAGPSAPQREEKPLAAAIHWGKVAGGIASARALVEKNVRDIPRMPSGMKATEAERARIRSLLSGIRLHAGRIVRSLSEEAAK